MKFGKSKINLKQNSDGSDYSDTEVSENIRLGEFHSPSIPAKENQSDSLALRQREFEHATPFQKLVIIFRHDAEQGKPFVARLLKLFKNKEVVQVAKELHIELKQVLDKNFLGLASGNDYYGLACQALVYVLLEDSKSLGLNRQAFKNKLSAAVAKSTTNEAAYFLSSLSSQMYFLQEGLLKYINRKCDKLDKAEETYSHTQLAKDIQELAACQELLLSAQSDFGTERIQATLRKINKPGSPFEKMDNFIASLERSKTEFLRTARSMDEEVSRLVEKLGPAESERSVQFSEVTFVEFSEDKLIKKLTEQTVTKLQKAYEKLQARQRQTTEILEGRNFSGFDEADSKTAKNQIEEFKGQMQQRVEGFIPRFIYKLQNEAIKAITDNLAKMSDPNDRILVKLQQGFKQCVINIYSKFNLSQQECDKILDQFDKSISSSLKQITPPGKKSESSFGNMGLFKLPPNIDTDSSERVLGEGDANTQDPPGPFRHTS